MDMYFEWREINDFPGYYISPLGVVMSALSEVPILLKASPVGLNGGMQVQLRKDGKSHFRYVHRLVAEAFIPNPENKPQVDHIDTDTSNNNVANLRWATPKENANNTITLQHYRKEQERRKCLGWTPVSKKWQSAFNSSELLPPPHLREKFDTLVRQRKWRSLLAIIPKQTVVINLPDESAVDSFYSSVKYHNRTYGKRYVVSMCKTKLLVAICDIGKK